MPSKTLTPRLLATTLLGASALGFAATPAMADNSSRTVFEQSAVKVVHKKAQNESGRRDVASNHRGHRHDSTRGDRGRRGDDARNGRRGDDRADQRRRERKAERKRAERRAERIAERRREQARERRWERRRDRRHSGYFQSPWSNTWGWNNRHRSHYKSGLGISFVFGNDGYSRRRWSRSPHAFYNSSYGSYNTYTNQTYCERVLVQARHHGHYETVSVKQCSNPWDGTYIIQGSERVVNCLY